MASQDFSQLKIGDLVSLQRRGHAEPSFGKVIGVQVFVSIGMVSHVSILFGYGEYETIMFTTGTL